MKQPLKRPSDADDAHVRLDNEDSMLAKCRVPHYSDTKTNSFAQFRHVLSCGIARIIFTCTFVLSFTTCSWAIWVNGMCEFDYSLVDMGSLSTASTTKSGTVELEGKSSKTYVHNGTGTIHRYKVIVPANKTAVVSVTWTSGSKKSGTWPYLQVLRVGNTKLNNGIKVHETKTYKLDATANVDIYADALAMGSPDKLWNLAFDCLYNYKIKVEYSDKANPQPTPKPTDEVKVTFWVNIPNDPHDEDNFGSGNRYEEGIRRRLKCGTKLLPNAPSCKRSGYKFLGWYTASSGGTKITDSCTVPKTDLTLYAHWSKINEVKVSFKANGGTGSLGPQTVNAGQETSLLKNSGKIKREGYDFSGWAETSSGTVKYPDGGKIKISSSTALYAVWKARPINVYFNENWDGGGESVRQYIPGTMYGTIPSSPTRSGYVFVGWFNKSGTKITTTFVVPDRDTTLYARWEPRTTVVTVSFKKNDGTPAVVSTTSYSVVEGTPTYYGQMPEPARDGWYFVGWYTSDGKKIYSYSQVKTSISELYARWLHVPAAEDFQMIPVYTAMVPDWGVHEEVAVPAMIYGEFSTHDDVGWFSQNDILLFSGFSESGWFPIRFNSECIGTKVLSLAIYGDDNHWAGPIGTVVESGSFQVYLQRGNSYAFYLTLTDRESGNEICDMEPVILNYDIQIGGAEPLTGGLNEPPTPEVKVVEDGIQLTWALKSGATKYHVYRHSYEEVSSNTYDWIDRLIAVVDGDSSVYTDREINNDCSVNYSLRAVIDGEVSVMGGKSKDISLQPMFTASADVSQFSYLPSVGNISIDSNLKWEARTESSGDWLHVEDLGMVHGSRSISFSVDENLTSGDRIGTIWFNLSSDDGSSRGSSSVVIVQNVRGDDVQMTFAEKSGASSSRTYTDGETYDDLPTPERAGYSFLGWTTDEDGGDLVTEDTQVKSGSSLLFAQWTPNTCTVRFNANGGTGTMDDDTVVYDMVFSIPQCKFTKAGSVFLGWALSPDGDVVYCDGDDYDNLTLEDGVTVDLYAVWGDADRYYGPWGYEPETVRDDVAVSTLANVSFTVNGEEMAEGDIVAAYDSSRRLRAIGKVATVDGKLQASLSMNVVTGTRLMFLLWKNGMEVFETCVADTLVVAPEPGMVDNVELHLTGTFDTKVPFPSCEISLAKSGWHLVSFNALPDDSSPANVFAGVADKIDQVVHGSKVWRPTTGGRLTELQIGVGYWVRTSADNVVWSVIGLSNPKVEISLSKGWNLVGYPLAESGNTATVLKSAFDSGKVTQIVDGSKVYPGRLTTLEPSKGYWFYAPAACTITFNGE